MTSKTKPQLHFKWIDPHAFEIVKVLQKKGFVSYLVGGCVRDLLLKKEPKDFDIATMAQPPKVKKYIPFSFIIGKRFRLVLVKRHQQQYEVATFRRNITDEERDTINEEHPEADNAYGTPEEDANRRDFTINGLFYDPINEELIDYTGGLEDLKAGIVRMIGDPKLRLIEDPIRILRAIRLAHMVEFKLEMNLRAAIAETSSSLKGAALPRVREEILKLLRLKEPALAFLTSYDLGVLKAISPTLHDVFANSEKQEVILKYLDNFHHQKLETPMELFCGLINAYIRTEIDPQFKHVYKTIDLLEHEKLKPLMSEELGLFKYEQKAICRAYQLQETLKKTEARKKRGRIQSIVRSESFPLAMLLSKLDYTSSLDVLDFWTTEFALELPNIQESKHQKPGRRPRRKATPSNRANIPRKTNVTEPQDS